MLRRRDGSKTAMPENSLTQAKAGPKALLRSQSNPSWKMKRLKDATAHDEFPVSGKYRVRSAKDPLGTAGEMRPSLRSSAYDLDESKAPARPKASVKNRPLRMSPANRFSR